MPCRAIRSMSCGWGRPAFPAASAKSSSSQEWDSGSPRRNRACSPARDADRPARNRRFFYGRGTGVGRGLGVGSALGFSVGLGVTVGVGIGVIVAVTVGVAV